MSTRDAEMDICQNGPEIMPLSLRDAIARLSAGGEWRPVNVARLVGWHRVTVYRLVYEGKIEAVRRGRRHMRILGASVAAYLTGLQEIQ